MIAPLEEDTGTIGFKIGKIAKASDILLLSGDLGSGKTVLAKGIAAGAGVSAPITSPTYTLMNLYEGNCPVYHFDLYRLRLPEELYDLDYEEYFYGDGITLVEWPERLGFLMPDNYLSLTIIHDLENEGRRIQVVAAGQAYHKYLEVLKTYEGARR